MDGIWWLGRGRQIEGSRMHGLVHELALQVYVNIFLEIYHVVPKKLVEFFFTYRIVSSQTRSYMAQKQYMYDILQILFHMAILGGEGTAMKYEM